MRPRSLGILGALFAASIGAGVALAQIVTPPLSQVVTVDPTADLFLDVVNGQPTTASRYASAAQINAAPGVQYSVPVTGFSIQVLDATTYVFIKPAGTLANGTFLFPVNASDGQHLCFFDTATQSAVTMTAGTGDTLSGTSITALTAATQYCWRYVKPTRTWYYVITG